MNEAHFFFGTVVKTVNNMKRALSKLEYDINDAANTYDLESALESFFEYEAMFHYVINFIDSELKLYNTGDGDRENEKVFQRFSKIIKAKKYKVDKLLNESYDKNTGVDNKISTSRGIGSIKEVFYSRKHNQDIIKAYAKI
jgi:hypothetical protein